MIERVYSFFAHWTHNRIYTCIEDIKYSPLNFIYCYLIILIFNCKGRVVISLKIIFSSVDNVNSFSNISLNSVVVFLAIVVNLHIFINFWLNHIFLLLLKLRLLNELAQVFLLTNQILALIIQEIIPCLIIWITRIKYIFLHPICYIYHWSQIHLQLDYSSISHHIIEWVIYHFLIFI